MLLVRLVNFILCQPDINCINIDVHKCPDIIVYACDDAISVLSEVTGRNRPWAVHGRGPLRCTDIESVSANTGKGSRVFFSFSYNVSKYTFQVLLVHLVFSKTLTQKP